MSVSSLDSSYITPVSSVSPELVEVIKFTNRMHDIVKPIIEEIRSEVTDFPDPRSIRLGFSESIDPNMAYADKNFINVCPLFVIELSDLPSEIRPTGWNDPRLCDLKFLQRISDYISEKCFVPHKKVSFIDSVAIKMILKLKESPDGMKALRAGIAHELGHLYYKHHENTQKVQKQKEKEADLFAVSCLSDGCKGMEIGFEAWRSCMRNVRESSMFGFLDRCIMKMLITKKGNFWPIYFTHGFFEDRIQQVRDAMAARPAPIAGSRITML